MIEPRLSPATRALLHAAKADAPSAAARAKVWSTVASTAGGAAGACAAGVVGTASTPPGVLVAGGASASKMLVLGALLGGTVTVGLATFLLRLGPAPEGPAPSPTPVAVFAPTGGTAPGTPGAPFAQPVMARARVADVVLVDPPPAAPLYPGSGHGGPVSPPPPAVLAPAPSAAEVCAPARRLVPAHAVQSHLVSSHTADDMLAREASLVAQAHAALLGGDAHGALRAVRAARMLPSRILGPEELSLEAQALRALGRDDQARDVDSALKRQFPESALAPR
jgi:hypothetical protein